MNNYSQLIERIAQSSGIEAVEVERKIDAKRAKLSGLISKEGAAQIVAAELGVSLDQAQLKISELVEGMKRVHVVGKITKIFPVRSYSKNGREGKIGSFLLGDESSNVRTVLWDMHHIGLIENGELKEGDVVEINSAGIRNGEMHLGAFSDLKQSSQKLEGVKTSRACEFVQLRDARPGIYGKVRATIVQMFDPKYFEDKREAGKQRALVNVVLDDGTESLRALMNDSMVKGFGLTDEEVFSLEAFGQKKQLILGEEKLFTGTFKINSYFNKLEMSIDSINEINTEELIKELEAQI